MGNFWKAAFSTGTNKVAGRSQNVLKMHLAEKLCLHFVSLYRYKIARIANPTVGDYAMIRFDKNDYSVIVQFLRKTVTVKGDANRVVILCDRETIITYDRFVGHIKTAYKL